jgi:hypothetical protein
LIFTGRYGRKNKRFQRALRPWDPFPGHQLRPAKVMKLMAFFLAENLPFKKPVKRKIRSQERLWYLLFDTVKGNI